MSADAFHRVVPNDCQYGHKDGNESCTVISFCQHLTSAGSVPTFASRALNIGPVTLITTNNKNLVYYTVSWSHLYFTLKYSRNTTTCFGPMCGPSSGCDLTYRAAIQDVWGVCLGYWGWVGGGERRGRNLAVSIVGTVGTGGITSGLSFVFYVHVSKWVSILMLRMCYY